uniref:Uncharacterized protein n=1 Tax=Streptomyces sp. NBC_00093 TaxID=2975649 RepID=A0AAU2AG68_9ACTN
MRNAHRRAAEADPTAREALREAVRADGFCLVAPYEASEARRGVPETNPVGVRLLPPAEPRAPLAGEITALEHDFERLGTKVARNGCRWAVDNLVEQRFEAANGRSREMFGAVAVHVATGHGFTTTKQGAGGTAVRYLVDQGLLPENGGGSFVRGVWPITHTNGPRPGTSHTDEAHFRLQALTGVARHLIDRLTPAQ